MKNPDPIQQTIEAALKEASFTIPLVRTTPQLLEMSRLLQKPKPLARARSSAKTQFSVQLPLWQVS